ncbi:hypothetical protein CLOSTMETH_03241 [[Clostridium] methylpentosum DSM 5476]|uniref:Uncharacterized protein n=1 Tax=[Clostridium] methylpentosum DSM 5476 TaxID=537013 RepID=C0EH41_9FIRM|nr:hypothetical protein CLOSTMETH_03241 [[Clostridium] methylpentosum DSM 5476]
MRTTNKLSSKGSACKDASFAYLPAKLVDKKLRAKDKIKVPR